MNSLTHTAGTVTVQVLDSNKGQAQSHPNDVEFTVKYPEGYTGNRIMPEGKVIISKEAAEKFTALGIGSVAGSADEKPEQVNIPAAVATKNYGKMTKDELKAELTAREISFNESALKPDLITMLESHDSQISADEKPEQVN